LALHRSAPELLQRVLRRAHVSEVVMAFPSGYRWPKLERMLTTCLDSKRAVFNFILHSSEVMVGGAPWIQDDAAVEEVYERLRRCIAWLRGHADVRFVTLGEIGERHPPSAVK